MFDDSLFEMFAHYARGMATMSFVTWSVLLWRLRKRNRMTFLLFVVITYIAVGYLKDCVFLLPSQVFTSCPRLEDCVSLFDIAFTPIVCAFFLETTRPGFVRMRSLALTYALFIAFIPLYCIMPCSQVLLGAFILSSVVSVITMVLVPLHAIRYNNYLLENYSYTKDLSVKWCVVCTFGFFLWVLFFQFCFYKPTWFGEMLYDGMSVIIWNVICLRSRRHKVVVDMMAFKVNRQVPLTKNMEENIGVHVLENAEAPIAQPLSVEAEPTSSSPASMSTTESTTESTSPLTEAALQPVATASTPPAEEGEATEQMLDPFIATSLQRCMERDKVYLNPRLSLTDLASAVGTNKTYISIHINRQGKTFYDFINDYRITEACRIIDSTPVGERISMTDVAQRSGFNSISSFNRYFSKIKGITPATYARHRGGGGKIA